ncbi:hypothetical protein ElyMa_000466700 [Elysia marginata]|uniref:Uncharacterized protein n=1 Tax=Elysia marginata TaxID=1093978 RepID=A0AAV4FR02_9GAST|nr:hypothetical protein ElyMa_000466700 [Elysia marginata]
MSQRPIDGLDLDPHLLVEISMLEWKTLNVAPVSSKAPVLDPPVCVTESSGSSSRDASTEEDAPPIWTLIKRDRNNIYIEVITGEHSVMAQSVGRNSEGAGLRWC